MDALSFEVRHSEDGVRRAVRELWNARHRKAWWTSMAAAVLLMAVALATRDLPWYLAIPLTAVAIHAALLAWSRDRVMEVMAQALRRTAPPVFRYRLDGSGVAETSAMGSVELPWSSFATLREGREFVFLLRAPVDAGMFIAFPREQLPAPALAALRAHVPG